MGEKEEEEWREGSRITQEGEERREKMGRCGHAADKIRRQGRQGRRKFEKKISK